MADRKHAPKGYRIFLIIMTVLLIGAIALFIYGSVTNGLPQPRLPGKGLFALGTILRHG